MRTSAATMYIAYFEMVVDKKALLSYMDGKLLSGHWCSLP